jgi:hypothetical protein
LTALFFIEGDRRHRPNAAKIANVVARRKLV